MYAMPSLSHSFPILHLRRFAAVPAAPAVAGLLRRRCLPAELRPALLQQLPAAATINHHQTPPNRAHPRTLNLTRHGSSRRCCSPASAPPASPLRRPRSSPRAQLEHAATASNWTAAPLRVDHELYLDPQARPRPLSVAAYLNHDAGGMALREKQPRRRRYSTPRCGWWSRSSRGALPLRQREHCLTKPQCSCPCDRKWRSKEHIGKIKDKMIKI